MSTYITKNYTEPGGAVTHIGGRLVFDDGAAISRFPGAENIVPKTTNTAADIRADLNALIRGLKNAGLMVPDAWNVSVLACPTPSAMPAPETQANSAHATVSIDGTEIIVTLDCKVCDLADADHGDTWGKHKWLGFGVRTGLPSIVGVRFTDDTGAAVELTSSDADEATALGLSAGDFVLYIKADQEAYIKGRKGFTFWADCHAETAFTLRIVEPAEANEAVSAKPAEG